MKRRKLTGSIAGEAVATAASPLNKVISGVVPGRNEIDETQELYYPAIMKVLLKTGYKGFVGQEFVPSQKNTLESL